jgi:hypothetical protein
MCPDGFALNHFKLESDSNSIVRYRFLCCRTTYTVSGTTYEGQMVFPMTAPGPASPVSIAPFANHNFFCSQRTGAVLKGFRYVRVAAQPEQMRYQFSCLVPPTPVPETFCSRIQTQPSKTQLWALPVHNVQCPGGSVMKSVRWINTSLSMGAYEALCCRV